MKKGPVIYIVSVLVIICLIIVAFITIKIEHKGESEETLLCKYLTKYKTYSISNIENIDVVFSDSTEAILEIDTSDVMDYFSFESSNDTFYIEYDDTLRDENNNLIRYGFTKFAILKIPKSKIFDLVTKNSNVTVNNESINLNYNPTINVNLNNSKMYIPVTSDDNDIQMNCFIDKLYVHSEYSEIFINSGSNIKESSVYLDSSKLYLSDFAVVNALSILCDTLSRIDANTRILKKSKISFIK